MAKTLQTLLLSSCMAMLSGIACAGITVTPDAGFVFPDSSRAGPGNSMDNAMVFGAAAGYRFDNGNGLEMDVQHVRDASITTAAGQTLGKASGTSSSLNAYRIFSQSSPFRPFILLGAGQASFKTGTDSDKDTIANLGIGAFVLLSDNILFRGEVRNAHSFGSRSHDDMLALLGLQIAFGQKPKPVALAALVPEPLAAEAVVSDADSDGIPDEKDKCPNTRSGISVDDNGCPLDADTDGVPDYLDQCPGTPAGSQVDDRGCILDTDNDGVANNKDQCPGTPANTRVDERGCGITLNESLRINIPFEKNSAVIPSGYKGEIGKIAEVSRLYPTALITIQGFTDSRGSRQTNTRLSQARADAVRQSLTLDFSIPANLITATGYGPAQPLASNKTEEGRIQNRRVMAVISAKGEAPPALTASEEPPVSKAVKNRKHKAVAKKSGKSQARK